MAACYGRTMGGVRESQVDCDTAKLQWQQHTTVIIAWCTTIYFPKQRSAIFKLISLSSSPLIHPRSVAIYSGYENGWKDKFKAGFCIAFVDSTITASYPPHCYLLSITTMLCIQFISFFVFVP